MKTLRFATVFTACLSLTLPALAQLDGGPITQNDCAGVLPVRGAGTHAFDTSAATTGPQGQNEILCESFGDRTIDNDIWFEYQAGVTGSVIIETCGSAGTLGDSKIAVYPGSGCPPSGTALDCSDDVCGTHARLGPIAVNFGESFTVQIGSFPGCPGGTGNVIITETGMPPMFPDLANIDDCAMAELDIIVGEGTWDWDNSAATTGTQGQMETICSLPGGMSINNDIWFTWVPEASGLATIQTCNPIFGDVDDTRLAVYPGGRCPNNGDALACNDDACGFLSSVTFPAVLGECYAVQIGLFLGRTPGTGQVNISLVPGANVITNQDDCANASASPIYGDGAFPFNNAGASTGSQGQAECGPIANDVWMVWTAASSNIVTMDTCGSPNNTSLAVYRDTGACPADGTSIACNDDACGQQSSVSFSAQAGEEFLVQIGSTVGGAGTLNVSVMGQTNLGTNSCTNNANSTGIDAIIRAYGSLSASANRLVLAAERMPCNEFGYFLGASDLGLVMNPGMPPSAGNFCLGGDPSFIGRFVQQTRNSGGFGTFSIEIDLNAVPIADAGTGPGVPRTIPLMPTDTWYFQAWYRNDGGNNFTDAICVTITP